MQHTLKASPAVVPLSQGSQTANQGHLVFTDSISTNAFQHGDRYFCPLLTQVAGNSFPQVPPQVEKAALEKTVSFHQEPASSQLIQESNSSFKGIGKEKLFLFLPEVLASQVTLQN